MFALASLVACQKFENTLPGEWHVAAYKHGNSAEWSDAIDIHSYVFNADGTGNYTYVGTGGIDTNFVWSSDSWQSLTIGSTKYKVHTNTRKKQEWERSNTDGTITGIKLARVQ